MRSRDKTITQASPVATRISKRSAFPQSRKLLCSCVSSPYFVRPNNSMNIIAKRHKTSKKTAVTRMIFGNDILIVLCESYDTIKCHHSLTVSYGTKFAMHQCLHPIEKQQEQDNIAPIAVSKAIYMGEQDALSTSTYLWYLHREKQIVEQSKQMH